MRAFFTKRGLGAEFDKRVAVARDLWRRNEVEADSADPQKHHESGYARGKSQKSRSDDGVGWIERVSREVGYERVERAFHVLVGGVILAGCLAIVTAGFRGQAPVQPAEGVTQVQLAPQAKQDSALAAQETQNLQVSAPKAIESESATPIVKPPTVIANDILSPAVDSPAPQPAQSESVAAESAASEMPRASEPASAAEVAMAAPEAPTGESSPNAVPSAPAVRDTNADDKSEATERAAKCFVKVSGRVLTSGNCRVSHKGASVTFLHSGQPVTISPSRGREWSLTLGGRNVGKVYKVGGCWGSQRHTWICERGA